MSNWVRDFLETHPELAALPIAKRARHSIHHRRADGLIEANFVGKPCHENTTGLWLPIDTDLKLITGNYWGAQGVPARFNVSDRTVEIIGTSYAQRTTRVGVLQASNMTIKGAVALPVGSRSGDSLIADGAIGGAGWQHQLRLTEDGVRETITLQSLPTGLPAGAGDWLVLDTILGGVTFPDGWVDAFETAGMQFHAPGAWDANGDRPTCRRYARTIGGVQHLYTGIPVSWLASAVYPVVVDPDFAGDAADGYIYGYSDTFLTARSTAAGIDAVTDRFHVGMSTGGVMYYVYRGFLAFDTHTIEAGSTVSEAVLKLVATYNGSLGTDFDVEIVKQDWSAQNPRTTGNMDAAFDNCLSGDSDDAIWRNTAGMSTNTQYSSDLLSTAWVDKTGTTYYSLRSSLDVSATEPAQTNHISIASATHATSAYRPVLTVLYEEASVDTTGTGSVVAQPVQITGTGNAVNPPTTGTGSIVARVASIIAAGAMLISGTANVTAAPISVTSTAQQTHTATAQISAAAAQFTASGSLAFSGTGSVTATAAQLTGSGTVTNPAFTGTGSVVTQPAQLTGTGAQSVPGTGALQAQPAAVSGTGQQTVTGTATLQTQAAALAGSGAEAFSGTGSVAGQPATISGTSAEVVTGTGSLSAQAATLAGAGGETFGATGSIVAPSVGLSATGDELFSGTGSIAATPATLTGTAENVPPVITGTASITAQPVQITAIGGGVAASITGTGSVVAQPVQLAATGDVGAAPIEGTGSVTAQPAQVAATGTVGAPAVTGTASVTAQPAAISGAAVESFTGTGSALAQATQIAAAARESFEGTGSETAQPAVITGSGSVTITGAANFVAAMATITAVGTVYDNLITGTGSVTAQAAAVTAAGTVTTMVYIGMVTMSVECLGMVAMSAAPLGSATVTAASLGRVAITVESG